MGTETQYSLKTSNSDYSTRLKFRAGKSALAQRDRVAASVNSTTPGETGNNSPVLCTSPKSIWQEGFDARRIMEAVERLPENHERHTDIYFLRSKKVLEVEQLNPWVEYQVFVRKTGPNGKARVAGIFDLLAILIKYTKFLENGGRVWAVPEGYEYESCETLLRIVGRAQDLITLETMMLGVLSAATTEWNGGPSYYDLEMVAERIKAIRRATRSEAYGERPVTYFGARHYSWMANVALTNAAWSGGARMCATDIFAETKGQKAQGTIPHALETIVAHRYGINYAVVEAIRAFDRVIDKSVKRVCLPDFRNQEIADTLASWKALGSRLYAARLDTNGACIFQGGVPAYLSTEADAWRAAGLYLPEPEDPIAKYWYGPGVTVTGTYALRKALNDAGAYSVEMVLTGGFGDPKKAAVFTQAERLLGTKLFSSLGVGEVTDGCFFATCDIVRVGDDPDFLNPVFKAGRPPKPNPALRPALGCFK